MDLTEAMIFQHLYWKVIQYSIQKEVKNCDTCQHTEQFKNGKFTAKLYDEMPLNILCVYILGP